MDRAAAGQSWSATGYRHHAGFVATLGRPVLELLAPVAGERILDLGCGDGALTAELVATGAEVVGCDASPELLDAARARVSTWSWPMATPCRSKPSSTPSFPMRRCTG
ncbi:MAG: methyltransferase domain-containing protein [Geminicoccaceae bacterium]